MLSLGHFLFNERELYKRIKKNKSNLHSLREMFIETFFKDMDKRNPPLDELRQILLCAPFDVYPTLQKLYFQLINLEFTELDDTTSFDLSEDELFLEQNAEKNYFSFDTAREYDILCGLFNRLMLACQKMNVLIERTNPHDAPESAYKLMVLICEPGVPETFKFNHVVQQAFNLVKSN